MLHLLFLIPTAPFAGFLILATLGARLSRKAVSWIGVGAVGMSAILAMLLAARFILWPPAERLFTQTLWTWIDVGGFTPTVGFTLDALSLVMMVVVAFVSFLILLYSTEFMEKEEGYSRFFAYMNLFVGSMLTLVLADNLFLLYFGWEGVGACSYLLIGFWYKDPVNGAAARKAFIVTRIGDAAMAVGLFLLFDRLGTLNIQESMRRAAQAWPPGSGLAAAAAVLLLIGAIGKSAQWPLQTWLPDAMAGPAPVSALIHAATMVTAGVYLIARTHVLFQLAPMVQGAVAIIGAATLLMAGFSALTQSDIKRVLAYSTISQIGYMFLALGVGAWSAAIFHFMTHAFFKALLFLGAGVVVQRMDDEHNIFKMGGLWKQLPFTFWTFLIGACSLSALPLVTAGFYSKDLILSETWAGSRELWAAGLVGALLTSMYTFRLLFLVFFGKPRRPVREQCGLCVQIPLVVLAALSVVGGFFALPEFLRTMMPSPTGIQSGWVLQRVPAIVSVGGIYLAYLLFLRHRPLVSRLVETPVGKTLHRFWFSGWGLDWLYDGLLVRPYVWLARVDKNDVIDVVYQAMARGVEGFHRTMKRTQNGSVRRYAMGITFGAVLIVTLVLLPMILLGLIAIPMAGGLLAWGAARWSARACRWISALAMAADLALALMLWARHFAMIAPPARTAWIAQLDWPWIGSWGVHFHLAMDGLSLILVLLTAFLGLMSVSASWTEIQDRVGLFHFNLLWALAGILGVFLAMDLFLFYFFWEMMLVPMYFLIAIWGHERRIYASVKFFLFTQLSGLLMLLSILGLYVIHGRSTGVYTFDFLQLLGAALSPRAALWLMLGFFVAFAVKLAVIPAHTWLADAHTAAPTAGSVVLAGLLLKTGAYGLLRFLIPLFPPTAEFRWVAMGLGVIGILYGALLSFGQTDLKRLVAYTSVSHMGFVLLGIFAGNELALQGVMLQIVCHGLSTGALFMTAGALQERVHTREMARMGGLWTKAPRMGGVALFFALASLGLPGLGNFVGEFLVLLGTYRVNAPLAAGAALGLILSVVYALWMIQRVFHGEPREEWTLRDLGIREMTSMTMMMMVLVWLGFYPQPFFRTAQTALQVDVHADAR